MPSPAKAGDALRAKDICSFGYVLQAGDLPGSRRDAVRALAGSGRDLLILDPLYQVGSPPWTIPELETIRQASPGRRLIAYLSIGEAEDYRSYWKKDWSLDESGQRSRTTPRWLVAPNPDWPGNYKVAYWDKRWQDLILKRLRVIAAAEFDGVYLDIVDAYEFFEYDAENDRWLSGRKNPATGRSYRQDMVRWVRRIAEVGRDMRPGFAVVPQNGSSLLEEPDFADLVDGIGIEDLFTSDDEPQPAEHTDRIAAHLAELTSRGKAVMVVEYSSRAADRARVAEVAGPAGYTTLFTDRALKTLGRPLDCSP